MIGRRGSTYCKGKNGVMVSRIVEIIIADIAGRTFDLLMVISLDKYNRTRNWWETAWFACEERWGVDMNTYRIGKHYDWCGQVNSGAQESSHMREQVLMNVKSHDQSLDSSSISLLRSAEVDQVGTKRRAIHCLILCSWIPWIHLETVHLFFKRGSEMTLESVIHLDT